jgi:hypothetical protein
MNPRKRQNIHWMILGGLLGVAVTVVAACCCHGQEPPAAPAATCADAGSSPVVIPAPSDAGDAGDASDASPTTTPIAFDAGPSCGTHPWSTKAQECCPPDCCD